MRFSLGKAAVRVSPLYLFLLLCISVFDYTGILLQAFVASLLHEMGHLLCLLLQRRPVCALDFTVAGIRLDRGTDYCPSPADIPVYLAGPAVNLAIGLGALWLLQRRFALHLATLALIHLLLGAFNLLPISLLDGGQVLLIFLREKLPPRRAERLYWAFSFWTSLALLGAGLLLFAATRQNGTLALCGGYHFYSVVRGRQREEGRRR